MVANSTGSAEPKFSYITLEDDDVIVAGVAPEPEPAAASGLQSAAVTTLDPEPAAEVAPAVALAAAPVAVAAPETSVAKPAPAPAAAAKAGRSKGEYHETTLEDLQPASMPLTQKVVLIACVVALVGFAVWRLFLVNML